MHAIRCLPIGNRIVAFRWIGGHENCVFHLLTINILKLYTQENLRTGSQCQRFFDGYIILFILYTKCVVCGNALYNNSIVHGRSGSDGLTFTDKLNLKRNYYYYFFFPLSLKYPILNGCHLFSSEQKTVSIWYRP